MFVCALFKIAHFYPILSRQERRRAPRRRTRRRSARTRATPPTSSRPTAAASSPRLTLGLGRSFTRLKSYQPGPARGWHFSFLLRPPHGDQLPMFCFVSSHFPGAHEHWDRPQLFRERKKKGSPQLVSLRGSSVKLGTMRRRLAWPLRQHREVQTSSNTNYKKPNGQIKQHRVEAMST
jgi:hypothetical protein